MPLVWPATTVFLSKHLRPERLLLAWGTWWDGYSRPDKLCLVFLFCIARIPYILWRWCMTISGKSSIMNGGDLIPFTVVG